MKLYSILFAHDVPCYGSIDIHASDDGAAIAAAKDHDYDDLHTKPEWGNSAYPRIVLILDEDTGRIIAEDIPLEQCHAQPQEKADLLEALKALVDFAEQYGPSKRASHEDWSGPLDSARSAIAKARGRT